MTVFKNEFMEQNHPSELDVLSTPWGMLPNKTENPMYVIGSCKRPPEPETFIVRPLLVGLFLYTWFFH